MSQTITMQAQVGTIDPITGHMLTEDDVAVNRAIGPDRADPPSRGSRRPYGGGLPSGGPPGGGYGPLEVEARREAEEVEDHRELT